MKSCPDVVFSTLTLLFSILTTIAHPLQPRHDHAGDPLVRTVYQFPNETWVENLAVRSNGKILVALISSPEVWQVDPSSNPVTAELVHTFLDAISLLGIAEFAEDVFAVNVGNFSDVTAKATAGSWSVWDLDVRGCDQGRGWEGKHGEGRGNGHGAVKAWKITDIPAAQFLNGMTILPGNPSTVLVADSGAGVVYRLDTGTGAYSVALDEAAMAPNASFPVVLGVNGVQFAPGEDDFLYFTNSFKEPLFSGVPVDPHTGSPTGPVEAIVDSFAAFGGTPDDFTLDSDGNAWIANGGSGGLVKVDLASGSTVSVAGTKKTKVVGPTACHFGRTKQDVEKGTLYITNTGGIVNPPPGGIVGGSVFALNAAEF